MHTSVTHYFIQFTVWISHQRGIEKSWNVGKLDQNLVFLPTQNILIRRHHRSHSPLSTGATARCKKSLKATNANLASSQFYVNSMWPFDITITTITSIFVVVGNNERSRNKVMFHIIQGGDARNNQVVSILCAGIIDTNVGVLVMYFSAMLEILWVKLIDVTVRNFYHLWY